MTKKLFFLLFILSLQFAPAKAQWVTIPDTSFVNYLTQLYPSCMNGNQMDTTCSQIVNATSLNVSYSYIHNLTGIEYFINLTTLNCSHNSLTSLPVLPNFLTTLNCYYNQLTSLPALPDSLQFLYCSSSQLTNLPALPSSLQHLDCSNNQLTYLPTLPNSLLQLVCAGNPLSNLLTLPNLLQYLDCRSNSLTSLPALPSSLTGLACGGNQLTNLPLLPNSLQGLECWESQLSSLPLVLPDSLKSLKCGNNPPPFSGGTNTFTSLPAILPSNLHTLYCDNLQLTSLPQLPSTLTSLQCTYNQLTYLPAIPNFMNYFKIGNNNIVCLTNLPQVNDPSDAYISDNLLTCVPNQTSYSMGLPLCMDNDPIGNPQYCSGVANITGNVYTDLDTNCNYTNTDWQTKNIPVKVFDSQNNMLALSYTVNGVYSFTLLQPDSFTVKIQDNVLPIAMDCAQSNNQIVHLVSANQTIQGINFPVVCDTAYDIKIQSVNAQGWVFPGQTHILNTNITNNETWYNLDCGSSNNSGSVIIQVTGPATYIAPAANAMIPAINGNIFTYNITDFNTLTPASFGLILMTDTTAQAGAQICAHVSIAPAPLDGDTTNNIFDFCYQIVNSYDPNMKEVYPVNVLPGYDDWLTYTIHFQNTGNAPAFNIRLRDTLDTQLDINTFEVLGYSHPATTSINGNILTVKFKDIMLPDSTTDYDGSMGYFQYRIKPLANISNGSQIENTAYIYFDYNAPIVTNTTTNNFTTVVTNIPPKISDNETFSIYPNPSTGIFTFNPDSYRDGKNIKTIEVYNLMGELILSQGNAKQINLSEFPKGIYVARINGQFVNKLVKE